MNILIEQLILTSQSAYPQNWNITQQILTIKALTEKAMTSQEYATQILLMDMTKVFDTINKTTLMEAQGMKLLYDELHLMILIIHNVEIYIKIGHQLGDPILTTNGIQYGDFLSAILFIFCFARALQHHSNLKYHNNSRPTHLEEPTLFVKYHIYIYIYIYISIS